jgi:phospholipase/carboxylesterase
MVPGAAACEAVRVVPTQIDLAGLTVRIVDRPDAALTCVLFHGFGAPGHDLVSCADEIDAPVRFVFPAGPLDLSMMGAGRAWWMIDLARFEQGMRSGAPRDHREEIPDGLAAARTSALQLLDELTARFRVTNDRLVLGGFSQGAMLSLDVALHRPAPPAGLLLMSGTLIAESVWQPRLAQLRGVPVVMSHGSADAILPYSVAEVLRDRLGEAGAVVDWHAFGGGHEIPMAVLDAAGAMMRRLAAP